MIAHVRIKGVNIYKSKGRIYAYHRTTATRLKTQVGSGDFYDELKACQILRQLDPAIPSRS